MHTYTCIFYESVSIKSQKQQRQKIKPTRSENVPLGKRCDGCLNAAS